MDGLLFLGSTGQSTLNAHSDRDLLIVLDECDPSITNGTVFCDDTLVDLVIVTRQQVEDLIKAELGSISLSDSRASFFNWVPPGVIVLDKCGCLDLLRNALRRNESSPKLTEGESVSRSDHAIYNLAQTQRMSGSPDSVYQQAVDLRMLYQLSDLMVDYFGLRGLPWRGEKEAIRYWQSFDPASSTCSCAVAGSDAAPNASVCMPSSFMRQLSQLVSNGILTAPISCCRRRAI